MRRRDERARVVGPTWVATENRWRVTTIDPQADGGRGRRAYRYFGNEEEAGDWREVVEKRLSKLEGKTVHEALQEHEQALIDQGNKPYGTTERMRRLRLFFSEVTTMQLTRLSAERASTLYHAFRQGRSVDYHRNTLGNAKGFFEWCKDRGLVTANPFVSVKGSGRRLKGKMHLTGDEARRFDEVSLRMAEQGDLGALGANMLLAMGLRQSEVCKRRVRDLDLNGTALRVEDAKTEAGNRLVKVPLILQPLLLDLTEGRSSFAVLFEQPNGSQHTKAWLHAAVKRVCLAAGIPVVCPHGLRGTHSTMATAEGASVEAVSRALGHEDVRTTLRHYVSDDAAKSAQAARVLAVIQGGRS